MDFPINNQQMSVWGTVSSSKFGGGRFWRGTKSLKTKMFLQDRLEHYIAGDEPSLAVSYAKGICILVFKKLLFFL